jgi:hypothetical protein
MSYRRAHPRLLHDFTSGPKTYFPVTSIPVAGEGGILTLAAAGAAAPR